VLAAEVYLRGTIEANLIERIRNDLFDRLDLAHDTIAEVAAKPAAGKEEWNALAHRLGHPGRFRITFIRADGVVLGDSELDRAALEHVENHRDRPEVAVALAGRRGSSMRWSATIGRRLMYVAVPVQRTGTVAVVARLAVPLIEVDDAVLGLR